MFEAKNKTDLMIEVWEKLDCESVGREEIVAIETVIRDVYGEMAVDTPMRIARLLADEGAELRHSELMELHLERRAEKPPDASLLNLFDLSSLDSLGTSLRNAENLRKVLLAKNSNTEFKALRSKAIEIKKLAADNADDSKNDELTRKQFEESAQ